MVTINIGIGTDKKVVSKLSITIDDSQADEINVENLVDEIHTMMWRFARGWDRRGNIITVTGERVNGES